MGAWKKREREGREWEREEWGEGRHTKPQIPLSTKLISVLYKLFSLKYSLIDVHIF